ncbi:MAG TPA: hypothetical protein VKX17_09165 [Planctomycetota bacterium]|nr:hypothetical protein [Planctomycetota bacterium]
MSISVEAGPTQKNNRAVYAWYFLIVLLTVAFCVLQLHHSYYHGRMATLPDFDDISYINDGAARYRTAQHEGIAGLVKSYFVHPPHSPVFTTTSLIAFWIFGIKNLAAYTTTVIWVLALLLFADALLRNLPLWQRAGGVALALSIPFAGRMATEYRPDIACSLFIAAGAASAMRRGQLLQSRWRRALPGVLFAAAMLLKPSVFLLTGFLFCSTLALAPLAQFLEESGDSGWIRPRLYWRGRKRLARLIVSQWPAVAAFFLISLPHFSVTVVSLLRYFKQGMVTDRDIWSLKTDLLNHLRYYLDGDGGSAMLGWHLYALVALIGAALVLRWKRLVEAPRYHLVPMVLLAGFCYLTGTLNEIKTIFFGGNFDLLLFAAGLIALGDIASYLARTGAPVRVFLPAACVLFGALGARFPPNYVERGSLVASSREKSCNLLYQELRKLTEAPNAPVKKIWFSSISILNAVAPFLYYYKDDLTPPEVLHTDFHHIDWQIQDCINTADAVIATEPGNGEAYFHFPNGAFQGVILQQLYDDPRYEEVARVPTYTGKGYVIFRRTSKKNFLGFNALEGLAAREGPYPQWGMPVVRWGLYPSTRLVPDDGSSGRMELDCEAQVHKPGQTVAVKAAGKEVFRYAFKNVFSFEVFKCEFDLPAGESVSLEYAFGDTTSNIPRAVLFKMLRLTKKKLQSPGLEEQPKPKGVE